MASNSTTGLGPWSTESSTWATSPSSSETPQAVRGLTGWSVSFAAATSVRAERARLPDLTSMNMSWTRSSWAPATRISSNTLSHIGMRLEYSCWPKMGALAPASTAASFAFLQGRWLNTCPMFSFRNPFPSNSVCHQTRCCTVCTPAKPRAMHCGDRLRVPHVLTSAKTRVVETRSYSASMVPISSRDPRSSRWYMESTVSNCPSSKGSSRGLPLSRASTSWECPSSGQLSSIS
mmetsp:Transcript_46139/g.147632  ORF Transcript_46139/g.147632 Transcript_46139/m.147632 type:complete len:234 (-) Transcript_46139:1028-1729(-)